MEAAVEHVTRAISELTIDSRAANTSTLSQSTLANAHLQNLHQLAQQTAANIAHLNTTINSTLEDIKSLVQQLLQVEEQRANEERRHRRRQERGARGEQRLPVGPLVTQV